MVATEQMSQTFDRRFSSPLESSSLVDRELGRLVLGLGFDDDERRAASVLTANGFASEVVC